METPPVKGSPEPRGPTIVVGYDGSEASRAVVTFAARRAGRRGRVFVVHAFDLPPDFLESPNYDSLLGAPVSTTHVVASSVVGAGRRRWQHIHWSVAREMGVAWLTTIPATAALAALLVAGWRGLL
jgi:Phosphate transporter family/Universal stress protein family